jgi:tyrosyl-tRNA synthetase
VELLTDGGVTSSKGEATRLIRGGGLYVNDERITDEKRVLTVEEALGGEIFVLRKGKKENFLVRITRQGPGV